MKYTCVFLGVLFSIVGIVFARGKGHIHLSAWKSMSQEEKEHIKIVPLCRNIGAIIGLNGIIFLTRGLGIDFEGRWFVATMVLWLVIAGLDAWYIGKSNRYRNP